MAVDYTKIHPLANLVGANLEDADLEDANLLGANLSGANLSGANLSGANLSGANLLGANLSGANLSGANLSGANLRRANLRRANLRRANLIFASLLDANLSGAHLEGASLLGAHLEGASLLGAHLEGASLLGAHRANLHRANLHRAHLEGAILGGTQLAGVDARSMGINEEKVYVVLSGAHHLTQEQLDSMVGDRGVVLPEGLQYPDHWPVQETDEESSETPRKTELIRELSATSPIEFRLSEDGKIHAGDSPLGVAPPDPNPQNLAQLIKALRDEIADILEDVQPRSHNFDTGFIEKQLNRYAVALQTDELNWHRLDSKQAQLWGYMQRERAEETWSAEIVAALKTFMAMHQRLEPLIRPEQPANPESPPEIDEEKWKTGGNQEELAQKIDELQSLDDSETLVAEDTRQILQDQRDDLTDSKLSRDPQTGRTVAQIFSAFTSFLTQEGTKLAQIARNVAFRILVSEIMDALLKMFFFR